MAVEQVERARITVVPIAERPWTDVEAVFGTRGDPAGCWCQFFKLSPAEWRDGDREERKEALRVQTLASPPGPGLIASLDDEPVGWCGVQPRPAYPALLRSRLLSGALAEAPDDERVWAVTCFVVRVGKRKQGFAEVLLEGAVDLARRHSARAVEAYPLDTSVRDASAAELFHGPLSVFLRLGFTEVGTRTSKARPVVRLAL